MPIVGALVGAALGYWYLQAPGRSVSTALQDLGGLVGSIKLSASQMEMAAVIEQEFSARGYGYLVRAAIANAYAESRLDPNAVGDGGAAVGLFQVHPWGGSVEARKDPVQNCLLIMSDHGMKALAAHRGSATNAELAALFAQLVERCGECGVTPGASTAQLTYRADLVTKLFGASVAAQVPV